MTRRKVRWGAIGVFGLGMLLGASPVRGSGGPPVDAQAAFERLTQLVGTWEAKTRRGGTARVTYELIADGSVLVERFTADDLPGGGAMLTTYHLDGRDLLLTHYCVAKNQPRMRAVRFDPVQGELAFEFVGATNLPDPRAGHMRRAHFRFEDRDHFTSSWEFFENGRLVVTDTAQYTRVRRASGGSR